MEEADERLREFATDRQWELYAKACELGSMTAAGKLLGMDGATARRSIRRLKARAALAGIAPGHFEHGTAPGYRMGKVTVQRGPQGDVERVWERQHPVAEDALEIVQEAMAAAIADMRGAMASTPVPTAYDRDLLVLVPMGDPHFGLKTWAREVGENFDLKIAERLTFEAVDRLCAMTPSADTAMLLNLGDFFHADNSSNKTPQSGNPLDVDGRFQLIAQVGLRAMVRCIGRLLEKHARVIVRNNRGNHDPHQAYMLTLALDAMYHAEPRVSVDMSPASFFYYRFGKTLIGSTHGDGAKLADLPGIMANDAADDWAAAKWRVWHCGHFHHDQVKDMIGCTVETHRTLAANDAWHRHQGYRSNRDMKAIVYHREHGEVSRVRCGLSMLGTVA